MCGPGCSTNVKVGSSLIWAMLSGGTSTMKLTPPESSSVNLVCSSTIGRKTRFWRCGRAVEVVGVAFQRHPLIVLPTDELEGTRADWILAVILAEGHDRLRTRDESARHGERVEERSIRLLEVHDGGELVDDFDFVDSPEVEGREGEGAGVVVRMLRIEHPVEGELHRVGVERRAVMEAHAVAEVERVGQPVLGNVPGLGEQRLDVEGAGFESCQAVVNVADKPHGVDVGELTGIEGCGLGHQANDERSALWRLLRRGSCRERRQGRNRRGCHGDPGRLQHAAPCISCF